MSNHNNRGSWEPNSFQIDLSDVASPKVGIRKGRRIIPISGKFIKGPVNVVWLSQARQLGVAALWVGLSLWFLRGLRRSDSFYRLQPDHAGMGRTARCKTPGSARAGKSWAHHH
jgi:hypothetical protein